MRPQDTLAELVAINSVSARSNAAIVDYLERRCESLGFATKRFPYRDENDVEKINLIALAGTDFSNAVPIELALVGHTDTVPFASQWTEATTLTERDGKLYGRGACDTKGFIAAALSAVEVVGISKLQRPLSLIFTADEEIGLIGAKRLADERPLQVRYSIVGEPTSLKPMRAGKGYCLAEIIVRGKEGHSAYPALGASAIFRAARLINAIERIARQLESDQHANFDPPFTTLNVGLVRGGTAKNVIPGECRLTVEWRPIPGQAAEHLLELLDVAIGNERKLDADFNCEVNANRTDAGFEEAADSSLVQLLERLTGQTAGTVAFGTEAAQLKQLGAEAVVVGPGDIRVAHQTGEYVPVTELDRCVDILVQAISAHCA